MELINSLVSQFKPYLKWHKSHLVVLAVLVTGLVKHRTVNLTQLALSFPNKSETSSCYRRLQRFFAKVSFEPHLFAELIAGLFAPEGAWTLSMDRTNWKLGSFNINILFLAICHDGMSIPITWTLLDKKGSSSTAERIMLLQTFKKLFPNREIKRLLADREFKGKRWLKYLIRGNWSFVLRIPSNTAVTNKAQNRALPVTRIFPISAYETMTLTTKRKVWGQFVYLSASRVGGERLIVICNDEPETAISDYLKRWQIETMFQALKSRGFNLEDTHLQDRKRIEKLIAVLAISFCWSYKVGELLAFEKPIKIKSHGRKEKSIFRTGLEYLQRIFEHPTEWISDINRLIQLLFYEVSAKQS